MPTLGAEVYPLKLDTSHGEIVFNVRDTAGQEKLAGLRDGYYVNADGALLMFDVTSRPSYTNVPYWYRDLERVAPSAPVVLVANKIDTSERAVKDTNIVFHRKKHLDFTEISVNDGTNLVAPLLYLARRLTGRKDVVITAVNERPVPAVSLPAQEEI